MSIVKNRQEFKKLHFSVIAYTGIGTPGQFLYPQFDFLDLDKEEQWH